MKLIVGLGNPGAKYKRTRHNLGFMAVDFLREKMDAPEFKLNKKLAAEFSKSGEIILAKPQTFMNLSGEAVAKLLSFYKLGPESLIVIHDDIDLNFGKIKQGKNRGPAGHNGVKSIFEILGTKDFSRLRVGVGPSFEASAKNDRHRIPAEDYVLQNFPPDELKQLPEIFQKLSV